MTMINLEKKLGPWSLRVWGLILNLAANTLALYGAAGVVRNGSRLPLLILGCGFTLVCVLVLAVPSRSEENPGSDRAQEDRETESTGEE
jgi:hypothetical protein